MSLPLTLLYYSSLNFIHVSFSKKKKLYTCVKFFVNSSVPLYSSLDIICKLLKWMPLKYCSLTFFPCHESETLFPRLPHSWRLCLMNTTCPSSFFEGEFSSLLSLYWVYIKVLMFFLVDLIFSNYSSLLKNN